MSYDPTILAEIIANPHLLDQLDPKEKEGLLGLIEPMITDVSGWPKVFINRDTKRTYMPHTVAEYAFVYEDTPRRGLLRGGEGCLSAKARINGVPIPEWRGGEVNTIMGRSQSTRSYLKGKADLYWVQTAGQYGVEATLDHRFLTPSGWRLLRDLSPGDLIAAYNEWDESSFWEECQDISFTRHGEYYDLSVPFWEHYEAEGLFHHNSGKSTAGIIKSLNRVRRGLVGCMASPNLAHFNRSLWKEFQRWCPWDCVIPSQRRMASLSWTAMRPFDVVFDTNSYIHMVGVKNVGSLEGPNLNWVHFDEARHYPDKSAIVTLEGRVRIPGPKNEPPQMWFTSTPRMNWLFDFFGPVQCKCLACEYDMKGEYGLEIQAGVELACRQCGSKNLDIQDKNFAFKMDSRVVRLTTKENEPNLMDDFAKVRGDPLTEAERGVLLEGLWGQIEEGQPFLPSILWWDRCKEEMPVLSPYEPIVVALDAATGSEYSASDCFAVVGVSRHWNPDRAHDTVAVRFHATWQANPGELIDFQGTTDDPGPERFLLRCCGYDIDDTGSIVYIGGGYNVVRVVFDPTELHDMRMRLQRNSVASLRPFGQTAERFESDRQLLNLITQRRFAHDGNMELRSHIQNADRKLDSAGKKMRIVKRHAASRIDLAVGMAMGSHECLRLNII